MANHTFKDAAGTTRYRKATGAGTDVDPAVLHNIVDSSALPTGAATAALQTTGNGILTTMDADTGSISSSATSIDGKITACNTGAVVISSSALPTGASTAANQTTIIGHIDGLEAALTTANGHLTDIDAGIGGLDTLLTGIDSDTNTIQSAFITEGTSAATHRGVVILMEIAANEARPLPGTVADGLLVNLGSNNDVTITGTVDLGATDNAVLDAIAASLAGTLTVGSHAVTNAGTFAVQESGGALTALQIMDDWDNGASDGASVSGDVAHDTADAGEPVKIGGKATTSLAGVTPVANNNRTNANFTTDGRQIIHTDCSPEDLVDGTASNTDGTSTQCIAAQGSGVRTYLESITLSNSSASAAEVVIKNGTTARWTFPVPANKSGVVFSWKKALRGDANTAWNFDPDGAYTTITCSMSGYKSKV